MMKNKATRSNSLAMSIIVIVVLVQIPASIDACFASGICGGGGFGGGNDSPIGKTTNARLYFNFRVLATGTTSVHCMLIML